MSIVVIVALPSENCSDFSLLWVCLSSSFVSRSAAHRFRGKSIGANTAKRFFAKRLPYVLTFLVVREPLTALFRSTTVRCFCTTPGNCTPRKRKSTQMGRHQLQQGEEHQGEASVESRFESDERVGANRNGVRTAFVRFAFTLQIHTLFLLVFCYFACALGRSIRRQVSHCRRT
jgi:hypothetical protein